jgi:undecaprenyl-diphosphatase
MYYDLIIFNFVNGFTNQSKAINLLGIFLAEYLPYVLGIFLLSFLIWPKKDRVKNRTMVFVALVSAIVARLVKTFITFFYQRPRPYVNLPLAHKLISMPLSDNFQSFPSGHTIFFFALSTAIYFYNKKLGIFFFICSALIGIARVFAGVHWPSDIVAGAVLGTITAFIVQWFYEKYKHSMGNLTNRIW